MVGHVASTQLAGRASLILFYVPGVIVQTEC